MNCVALDKLLRLYATAGTSVPISDAFVRGLLEVPAITLPEPNTIVRNRNAPDSD